MLKPLLKAFPRESFIYLGDTARLPYGTKSLSTLQLYLKQMASYLLEMDIKGLVIACKLLWLSATKRVVPTNPRKARKDKRVLMKETKVKPSSGLTIELSFVTSENISSRT